MPISIHALTGAKWDSVAANATWPEAEDYAVKHKGEAFIVKAQICGLTAYFCGRAEEAEYYKSKGLEAYLLESN